MQKKEKTILFVDDDSDFLQYVSDSIQKSGYRVLTKTDGHAALSLLDDGVAVDLVITDHVMPGMNGLKFIAEVRKRLRSVPIVLLTACADVENYFRALDLGVYEVTCKPINMRTLQVIANAAIETGAGITREMD